MSEVKQAAYYLTLIGGILLLILGVLSFLVSVPNVGPVFNWGFAYASIVAIICGVIAIIGAKSVTTLVWAIVLIIVGAIGGGLGGILVIIGGIIGLIVAISKKA